MANDFTARAKDGPLHGLRLPVHRRILIALDSRAVCHVYLTNRVHRDDPRPAEFVHIGFADFLIALEHNGAVLTFSADQFTPKLIEEAKALLK